MEQRIPAKKSKRIGQPAEEKVRGEIDLRQLASHDRDFLIRELESRRSALEMQNEELRTAQLELQSCRRMYSNLYDFAPAGYFTIDSTGIIRDVNLTGARMLGTEKYILINRQFIPFIAPDHVTCFQDHLAKVVETGNRQTCTLMIRRKDGIDFSAELQSAPLPGSEEQNRWCLIAMSDITDQRKFERLLKESEDHYRSLVESSPEAICLQQDERFRYLNPAAMELFGVKKRDDIIGVLVLERVHPDFHQVARDCIRIVEEQQIQTPPKELKILRMDGQAVEVEVIASPVSLRNNPAIQVVMKHVTARKMAEQALRFQAGVLSQVNDAIFVVDSEDRITYWNRGAEQLYRYAAAEVLGRKVEEINRHCWTGHGTETDARETLNRKGSCRCEAVHFTKDGEKLYVDSSISMLKNESGASIGKVVVVHDMTERKLLEKDLRESEERYRSLVESSPEAIWVEQENICVYLNPAGLELLGGTIFDQVKGKKFFDFIHPDFVKPAHAWFQEFEEKGNQAASLEFKILGLNGKEVDAETVATRITFGGRKATQLLIKDISDRKHTELRLRLQATVLSQVNDAVVAVGREGRIIFWNEGAERLYKLTAEEAIGRQREDVYQYARCNPDGEHTVRDSIASSGFLQGENVHILPNGQEINVESSVSVLQDWSGAPAGWLAVMRDITERKEAERALQESEERQRAVFDNSPAAIFVKDLQGRFMLMNKQMVKWLNVNGDDFLGKSDYDLFSKQIADKLTADDRQVIESGSVVETEEELEYGGSLHTHLVVKFPLFDHSGRPYAVCGISTDITERKRAEQAIKEARDNALLERNRLETVLNTIPSGVFVDVKGLGVLLQNKQVQEIAGRQIVPGSSADERVRAFELRKPDGSVLSPEELPSMQALTYGKYIRDVEMLLERPDGSRITISANAAPLLDSNGNIIASVTAFTDITERKQVEDVLKKARMELELRVRERTAELATTVAALQSEIAERKQTAAERDKLVAAVESTAEAIVVTDRRGIIEYVNPSFEQITGFSKNEVIGNDLHCLDSGQYGEDFFARMREVIRDHGVWKGRLVNRKKDGTLYYEDCTYSPVKDPSGAIVNYVSIKHDVTEKLRLESIAETMETMNNIGQVFSGIRHEIGNPVSSLLIIMSLLKKKYDTSSKETIREYIEQAMTQVERLEYLLTSLKNFNMYENLQIRTMAVLSFIEKFAPLVMTDLQKRGIRFEIEGPPHEWLISADPRALQQALLNIVVNAADALAEQPDPIIAFQVSKTGEMVRIRVSDNGIGISEDRKKDLFKPFYTTKSNGTGLGLVITRKLVSRMSGYVEIESRIGQGTIVDIYLPEGTVERPA